MSDGGRWGALGIAGILSLCCIGLGSLAGGAALAGGSAAGVTAVTTSGGGLATVIVPGIVTALTVLVVGLFLGRRARKQP